MKKREKEKNTYTFNLQYAYRTIRVYIYIYIYIMMRNLYKIQCNLTWLCQILRSRVIFIYRCTYSFDLFSSKQIVLS
jgi:hypothetical protein